MENWFTVEDQLTSFSLTHKGNNEKWFTPEHDHDPNGADLRKLNSTNQVMVERGIKYIIIDSSGYQGNETFRFTVI